MRFYIFFFLVSTCSFAQSVKVIKFPELNQLLNDTTATIRVVNFWATWCGPCVKELPNFESVHRQNLPSTVITLVSLDFADNMDKVKRFVHLKKILNQVIILDELDYNAWIDKVDESWTGAIPATLVLNTKTGRRKFVEKELREDELLALIKDMKQN